MSKPHDTPAETVTDSEDAPASAADALAIIERQQAAATARMMPNMVLLYGTWGVAWTVAFGAFYLIGARIVDAPIGVAGIVMAVVFVLASVASIVQGVRASRGLRGPSERTGMMYGVSWMVAMTGMGVLLGGVQLPGEVQGVIYPAAFVLVAGVLYLFGGTLWNDSVQYVLGVWLIAVAAASTLLGTPNNYLVLAIAGGGGLLASAGYHAIRGNPA